MNMMPSNSRSALRNLLVVFTIVVGFVLFSYGWTVTDISLEEPQEPRRQEQVGRALRELFSPNIFEQDYETVTASAPFLMQCPTDGEAAAPEAQPADEGGGSITISTACGTRGDQVTITGTGFVPNTLAQVRWTPPEGESRPRDILGSDRQTFDVAPDGSFSVAIEVPTIRGSAGETHLIEVDVNEPVGAPVLSEATHNVIDKMIETIFLALIATVISIPPSIILSFFAARNLMKPVRLSLGNLLVSVALLPVGFYLGALLLGPLGQFAANIGQGTLLRGASAGSAFILLLGVVTTAQSTRRRTFEVPTFTDRLRGALMNLFVALVVVLVIGLLGGLLVLLGNAASSVAFVSAEASSAGADVLRFIDNVLGYIGNFIGTVGELLVLLIVPIAGVVGAFSVSSIGNSLTMDALKRVNGVLSHMLGFVLGAISGALVLGAAAFIATLGALLGLLPPVVAAAIGGSILPLVYDTFLRPGGKRKRGQVGDDSIRTVLMLIGAAIAFYVTFVALNVGKSLIEGVLPTEETTVFLGMTLRLYVVTALTIGGVLGAVSGGLAGTRASFPLGDILYNTTRTILNSLRSIEPLIMGLIFVIWVGIGPFAGVLALTLHSIASLGKLYSEQLESIDSGPIEALESTGANRLQTIIYGAVPQIIPPYIAFTMYRWDINVRMSTIIGFVGGGGIGFLLQQQLNLLRYRDAGVAVLAIAIVVSILDYASANIRERYI